MAVPKRKISRSRRGNRRSHDRLRVRSLSPCPQCTEPRPPHRVCPHCGAYRGKIFTEQESVS
ncbi:50S ribosomal protein L32 [Dissulfurirhabdus thermomarina]|uniref:Large ribosomal subunit protein bL32 n=1 Tax=Dissulfurirhabdus thermomarina TaxID=1765737 RepID=A0A6N9TM35_DISTH|nr:50S ribosomal protein L32 [Dissulfurirhabdus thermomarina]NDY42179.1 50S ribosomal protein L32 [Dissulfurirhabdus thermomarina]NMX22519.1 50S ribosomal protein L32 [Dissulfurirhabdus thermomarina]